MHSGPQTREEEPAEIKRAGEERPLLFETRGEKRWGDACWENLFIFSSTGLETHLGDKNRLLIFIATNNILVTLALCTEKFHTKFTVLESGTRDAPMYRPSIFIIIIKHCYEYDMLYTDSWRGLAVELFSKDDHRRLLVSSLTHWIKILKGFAVTAALQHATLRCSAARLSAVTSAHAAGDTCVCVCERDRKHACRFCHTDVHCGKWEEFIMSVFRMVSSCNIQMTKKQLLTTSLPQNMIKMDKINGFLGSLF